MPRKYRLALCSALLLTSACKPAPKALVVGSKATAENAVLGEIVAQHIQNKIGLPVVRRTGLQGSLVAHQSLQSGEIDMYVEDAGSMYYSILNLPLNKDLDIVASKVALEYQGMKIKWLGPLGHTAGFAVVALRDKINSETLSSLAGETKPMELTMDFEFQNRVDCLPAMRAAYPFKLLGGLKLLEPLQVAEQLKKKLTGMAVVSASDALTIEPSIRVLQDDARVLRSYTTAIAVSEKTLANNSLLEGRLKLLEGKVSTEALRKIQIAAKANGNSVKSAVAEFLQQAGLK